MSRRQSLHHRRRHHLKWVSELRHIHPDTDLHAHFMLNHPDSTSHLGILSEFIECFKISSIGILLIAKCYPLI